VAGPITPSNGLTAEALKRRRARNWAVLALLLTFVAIVYGISIVKMSGGG